MHRDSLFNEWWFSSSHRKTTQVFEIATCYYSLRIYTHPVGKFSSVLDHIPVGAGTAWEEDDCLRANSAVRESSLLARS